MPIKNFQTSPVYKSSELIADTKIEFREFDLSNGLHCVLYKDNKNPLVNLTIGYKTGSKDEENNKKGMAHFFEHMMFQGSENVKKNEHFNYIMQSGGTCNAFTMQDATVYYDVLPSNNLDTGLWLESERMNSLDISEENLENQKSVVIEEKRQRYDNAPYGSMFHNIFKNVFKGSNYESSVIGETEDINSFTVNEAMDFHYNYYSPDNSVLILAGDIDYDKAEKSISYYFGDTKKESNIKRKRNIIKEIEKDIELNIHDNIQLPVLNICCQIPKAGAKENYAMEYFSEIIANNKSSRLYKKLVYERKLLKSISAHQYILEDGGAIIIRAMLNPGTEIEEIKKEIFDGINEFISNGSSDSEFQKVKNQLEFYNTSRLLKIENISLMTVFNYLYFKEINRINTEINNYLEVSKQDVIDCVNKFILNKNKLILSYLPINYKK